MPLRRMRDRLSKGELTALALWALAAGLVLWDDADGRPARRNAGWLVGLLSTNVAIMACAARNRRMHAHAAQLGYEAGRQQR
jgi:predicted nucleic acid-binding protein